MGEGFAEDERAIDMGGERVNGEAKGEGEGKDTGS
jgi:hypothetical protein